MMENDQRQILSAFCGDLMLARDCVSDLKSANFMGTISLRHLATADVLQGDTLQVYGSYLGGLVGRGILLGGFLGLTSGIAVSSAIDAEVQSLLVIILALALGAGLGWIGGWRSARRSRGPRKEREHQGHFVLRCEGTPDEITTAFLALRSAPCRNLAIHEGGPDIQTPTTSLETGVSVA